MHQENKLLSFQPLPQVTLPRTPGHITSRQISMALEESMAILLSINKSSVAQGFLFFLWLPRKLGATFSAKS